MEYLAIYVRVGDADPLESVQIEVAATDISEERSPFVGANVQFDADAAELGRHRFSDSPTQLVGRRLVAQAQARSAWVTARTCEAGLVEQFVGPHYAQRVSPHGRVMGPVLGW
jgi:hypothetical protein